MSRRWWAVVMVVVLAVAAVTVGIATSMAQGTTTLQSLSVAQLLTKVGDASHSTVAVSGDITWTNGLIPGSDLTGLLSGQSAAPSSLSGLALGGSGRLWLQQGSGLRLEAQGSGSDFVVVAGKDGMWSYSSANGTATHYLAPAGAVSKQQSSGPTHSQAQRTPWRPSPPACSVSPPQALSPWVRRPRSPAGPRYLLVMTPTSTHTTVGSVQVAVDARTFVPLRVQVFATRRYDSNTLRRVHERLIRAPRRQPLCLYATGRQPQCTASRCPRRKGCWGALLQPNRPPASRSLSLRPKRRPLAMASSLPCQAPRRATCRSLGPR